MVVASLATMSACRLALIALSLCLTSFVAAAALHDDPATGPGQRRHSGSGRRVGGGGSRRRRTDRPNVVFVLTDDQDIELGQSRHDYSNKRSKTSDTGAAAMRPLAASTVATACAHHKNRPVWARGRCRISPPRFLAECCKRQLNQGSFVLLYFRLSTFSDLY